MRTITILRIEEIERKDILLTPFKAWVARRLKIPVEDRVLAKANLIVHPIGALETNMIVNGISGVPYIVIGARDNRVTVASIKPQTGFTVNMDFGKDQKLYVIASTFSSK